MDSTNVYFKPKAPSPPKDLLTDWPTFKESLVMHLEMNQCHPDAINSELSTNGDQEYINTAEQLLYYILLTTLGDYANIARQSNPN